MTMNFVLKRVFLGMTIPQNIVQQPEKPSNMMINEKLFDYQHVLTEIATQIYLLPS